VELNVDKVYKPYTYALGWSKLNMWYYGVRYAQKCYVGDIWVTYFTSSTLVDEFVKNNGNPDIIKICKTFENINDAKAHEHKFLTRVRAKTNPKFINGHSSPAFEPFETNPTHNLKTLEKMRRTKKLQNLIKSVRNGNFIPHPKKIPILQSYISIIDQRYKTYPKIKGLLLHRIELCEKWERKKYPKNRKKTKRGKNTLISKSKIGRVCYHDPITKKGKMFSSADEIPEGWIKGLVKNTPNNNTPEVRKKISESSRKSRNQESAEKKMKRVDRWRSTRNIKEFYNV
jgi:hypothetical protein